MSPGSPGTLREALAALAGRPEATVTFGTSARREELSHADLAEQVAAAAGGFARQGVRPGDRVVLRAGSSRQSVLALLGLLHLGAVPVSVKPRVPGAVTGQYFATVTRQQDARHSFRVPGQGLNELDLVLRPARGSAPAPGRPEDLALVQYTSGSTGAPRPIPLSNRAVLGNIEAIASVAGMRVGHAGLIALPLHHDMGLVGVLTSLVRGLDLVIEEPGTFLRRPMAALRLMREAERVHSAFPDFMLRYVAARVAQAAGRQAPDPGLLAAWSTVFCGAEPIRRATVRAFLDATAPWGVDPKALVFGYGLAEAVLMATSHRYVDDATSFRPDGPVTTACLGAPVPGLALRVVDEAGHDCPAGRTGTLRSLVATGPPAAPGADSRRTDAGRTVHQRGRRTRPMPPVG
ncbi:AMP-binding protein [Streptomyces sp. NPDC033538]|uniref:AMP-binding protein n=1 Tax=Streptomyces sp. NPDC033538 TaxID=3155367 RepID=UPI0033FCE868